MIVKLVMLLVFFAVMIGVGIYARKHAGNVTDFVLGGRSVGPWLTAFAYGTSYFSAVVFVGYAGQFGWKYLDRTGQCRFGKPAGLGGAGQKDTDYDPPSVCGYYAGFFWEAF